MTYDTLFQALSQVRDMACTARTFHLSGRLYPPLQRWGTAPEPRKDNRSDIYCLGAALTRLLPPAAQIPPEISPVLRTLLLRTLSPRPQGRYSCCEELLEDLDRVLALLNPPRQPAASS